MGGPERLGVLLEAARGVPAPPRHAYFTALWHLRRGEWGLAARLVPVALWAARADERRWQVEDFAREFARAGHALDGYQAVPASDAPAAFRALAAQCEGYELLILEPPPAGFSGSSRLISASG